MEAAAAVEEAETAVAAAGEAAAEAAVEEAVEAAAETVVVKEAAAETEVLAAAETVAEGTAEQLVLEAALVATMILVITSSHRVSERCAAIPPSRPSSCSFSRSRSPTRGKLCLASTSRGSGYSSTASFGRRDSRWKSMSDSRHAMRCSDCSRLYAIPGVPSCFTTLAMACPTRWSLSATISVAVHTQSIIRASAIYSRQVQVQQLPLRGS